MFALAEQMGSTFVLQMDQNKARYLKNKMCMQIPPEYIKIILKKKSLKKKTYKLLHIKENHKQNKKAT